MRDYEWFLKVVVEKKICIKNVYHDGIINDVLTILQKCAIV